MQSKKRILKNTVAQLIGKIISSGLTFAITYFIIRTVGANLYGNLTKVTALLAIGYTALDFGINAHVVRLLESKKKPAQSTTISSLIVLRIVLSLLVIAAITFAVSLLPGTASSGYTLEVKSAYLLSSATILLYGIHLSTNALFQHQMRYDKVVISASLGAITMFISSAFVLTTNPNLPGLILSILSGYVITAISSLLFASQWLTSRINRQEMISILRKSFPIGIVLLLSIIVSKTDTIILGILRSAKEVGEYSFAYKIFDFALVLPVFTMNSVYPLLLRNNNDSPNRSRLVKKTIKILFILSLLGVITIFFAAPAINYVKPGLTTSIASLKILSLSLPFFYLSAPIMWLMIATHNERELIKIYFTASLFNILGNLYTVPIYGARGSATLTIATELGILIWLYYAAKTRKYI